MKNVSFCRTENILDVGNVADYHPGPVAPSAADGASLAWPTFLEPLAVHLVLNSLRLFFTHH